jgi:hypothetical protein
MTKTQFSAAVVVVVLDVEVLEVVDDDGVFTDVDGEEVVEEPGVTTELVELSVLPEAPAAIVVSDFLIVVVVVVVVVVTGGAVTGVVGTAATASTYAVLERLRTSAADKPGFTASGMSSATTGATTVTRSVLFSMVGVLVPLSVTTT